METFSVDWLLLAQTTEAPVSAWGPALDSLRGFATIALVALVLFGLPILAARILTRKVFRMGDDYTWRVALVLSTLVCAIAVIWPTGFLPKSENWRGWPPKMGIDLQGGVILVYEMVEAEGTGPDADAATRVTVEDLVEPLRRRLDPGGVKEIVVRPYGQRQIEIIIPEVAEAEVEQVKRTISTAGHLQFRILVDAMHAQDERQVNAALDEANRKKDILTVTAGGEEEPLAQWMRIARDEKPVRIREIEIPDPKDPSKKIRISELRPLKFYPSGGNIVRDAETFEILNDLPAVDWEENKNTYQFERELAQRGIRELEVLVRMDDRLNVEGGDLEFASSGFDDRGGNAVHFNMTSRGAKKMAALTSTHLPISERDKYQMGIILDEEVLSAPTINDTISDRGMISGSFTDQEVAFLVRILQGGRLPASLNKAPISENRIDPLLGQDTIFRSMVSMILALSVTLLFIIFWYRGAGIVASVALLLNLAFTLALLVLFSVALSLPGVAGLVLSVGMSVDANILIFERMREERLKGSSFRLAIRNGFNRASTTIIDSNLTTLITAFVLYFIGTDQIKGFAITLILGILTSMFTAIFVAKLIFEIGERRGWMKEIYSFGAIQKYLVERGFDFVRIQTICVILSIVLSIASIGVAIARGAGIFDIDFNGGTSVTMLLDEKMDQETVDAKLAEKFQNVQVDGSALTWNVVKIGVASGDSGERGDVTDRLYKVDSSYASVEELQKALGEALTVDGKSMIASYTMNFTPPEQSTRTVPVRAATTEGAGIDADAAEGAATGGTTTPGGTAAPGTGETPATGTGGAATGDVPAPPTTGTPAAETPAPGTTDSTEQPEGTTPEPGEGTEAPAPPAGTEPAAPGETTPPGETPEPGSSVGLDQVSSYFVTALLQEEQPAADAQPPADAPAGETPAADAPATDAPANDAATTQPETTTPPAAETPAGDAPAGDAAATTPAAPATREVTVSTSKITVENRISSAGLIDRLVEASAGTADPLTANEIDLLPLGEAAAEWNPDSQLPFQEWQVTIERDSAQTLAVLQNVERAFASDYVFPSSSEIGGQVAGKTKTMAAFALLFSMIGIVLYIWFRFHKVVYGIAAVAALVHDVVITLGAVAVSYWVARYIPGMSYLGIDEFKISLPVIAAFLTLMGYSLNDTIVVFDRIREVRGKSPYLDAKMINLSVNSTLSRTLLTSVTTFLSIVILFYLGGEGIHAFSFCLIIGIIVGTYSSIFIAAPILLWMSQRTEAPVQGGKKKPAPKTT